MKYSLLLLLALTFSVTAQKVGYTLDEAEYGKLNEIAGKNNVFVLADDMKARETIVAALEKAGFKIVFTRAEADFGLRFVLARNDVGSNVILGSAHNIVLVGDMYAYKWLPTKEGDAHGRVRVVWEIRKTQDFSGGITIDKSPAKNDIKAFIDAWKKVK